MMLNVLEGFAIGIIGTVLAPVSGSVSLSGNPRND